MVTSADGKLEKQKAVRVSGKQATVTVPAQSVTSLLVKGVSGVAKDAAELKKGHTYRLTGVQSGKDLTLADNGTGLVIKSANAADPSGQRWRVEQIRGTDNRKRYVFTETASDKRLAVRDGALVAEPDEGRRDKATEWIMSTTGDGTWTLVNAATGQLPDVGGQSTNEGASVGLWQPNSGSNQRWKVTDVTAD
ncbi:O-glycosyl hydrolase OS=Streptomyces violarus OX=67380 GN=FHS41_004499 PE=4 SV=1 [Streptomyces violarus]